MTEATWKCNGPTAPESATLAQLEDYAAGDPCLDIEKRPDGTFDFVIYRGGADLTVPGLSAWRVRDAARRILELVPQD